MSITLPDSPYGRAGEFVRRLNQRPLGALPSFRQPGCAVCSMRLHVRLARRARSAKPPIVLNASVLVQHAV